MRRAGWSRNETIVRGGTDGSRLTELGCPPPISPAAKHNFHSPLEWTCLEEMATAVRVLVEVAKYGGTAGNPWSESAVVETRRILALPFLIPQHSATLFAIFSRGILAGDEVNLK